MSDIVRELRVNGKELRLGISLEEIIDCQPILKVKLYLTGEELTALLTALENVEDKEIEPF